MTQMLAAGEHPPNGLEMSRPASPKLVSR